jgi:isopenicillin-N N-acyltransferase-like protein
MVGEGDDAVAFVRLRGNRDEMGYWYGRLLADSIAASWVRLKAALNYFPIPPDQLNAIVGLMWNPAFFDTAAWDEEVAGLARGCLEAGRPEITSEVLRIMALVPDIAEYNCSLFAAWGRATRGGRLFQLRNLDWTLDFGLQDFPVVVVYEPEDGRAHAVVGFAGGLGAAVGGLNQDGLAVSEIMGYFGDEETLAGVPFPILLRDVLYHDWTLDEALDRMQGAIRTNQYYYAVAAPSAGDPYARLLLTSHSRFDVYDDTLAVDPHPFPGLQPFHEVLDDVVYWKNHDGSGNRKLLEAIKSRYGRIDARRAMEIAVAMGVDTTLASIVYANSAREFWVAFAEGDQPATTRPFVHIRPFGFSDR